MHKYILKLTRYIEEGALTNDTQFVTADTPQQLADKVKQYNAMRYTSTDDEGKTVIGGKMYRVEPMQGVYEAIEDFDLFCAVNSVLR